MDCNNNTAVALFRNSGIIVRILELSNSHVNTSNVHRESIHLALDRRNKQLDIVDYDY